MKQKKIDNKTSFLKQKKLAIFGGQKVCNGLTKFNSYNKKELNASLKVLKSGVLSDFLATKSGNLGGKKVREFEEAIKKYFNVKFAITTNSWTTGLQTMLGAIDIQPGDEVIVPTWTMCATATTILNWLAIPIFVDINPDSFNLSIESVKQNISKKTKAIVVVDIFGCPANYFEIQNLAKKYNLKIISDSAQAPGSEYESQKAGTFSDIGGFSLNCHKHIQTGEGGIIVTNNKTFADRCRLIRNHGEAHISKYENLSNIIGSNFRLTEVQAAIGVEQLKKLDKIIKKKIVQAQKVIKILKKYPFFYIPKVPKKFKHVYYIIPIIYDYKKTGIQREKLILAIENEGLVNIFQNGYQNLHMLPIFQKKKAFGKKGIPWTLDDSRKEISYKKGSCPVAEELHSKSFIGFLNCSIDLNYNDFKNIDLVLSKISSNISDLKEYQI